MRLRIHWALTKELTFAQMKARYRGTVAGFFWVILNPVLMYLAQGLIFKSVLKIKVPNYALFLLGGLLPWTFVVTSLGMGVPVFQDSRQLLLAFRLPPFVLLASSILDNWINFLAAFLLILSGVSIFTPVNGRSLLLLPIAVLVLLAGVSGLLGCLSLLNVFYRDVRFITQFAVNLMFFLTPIFYPVEYVPADYRWLIGLNPLFALIDPVRRCVLGASLPDILGALARSLAMTVILLGASLVLWKWRKNDFYHTL